ncbi:MAG: SWIM zinc finger family protein, partial [Bacteroidetes bacterium]|nr:SWIM zinc finger family protein [Bacteroidota bacterium]
LVPSQSENGEKYTVIPGTKCTCPDHEVRQVKCKHLWAVEYVLDRETAQDGTVTETEIVKVTKVTRKTYPQNWTAYNAAQSEEKTRFGILLADLCRGIQQPIREGRGRPALPLADMLFASAYKVYTGFSSRRFTQVASWNITGMRCCWDFSMICSPAFTTTLSGRTRMASVVARSKS